MIRALNPLFPEIALRLRPRPSERPVFRTVSGAWPTHSASTEEPRRWDAPAHWIEPEQNI